MFDILTVHKVDTMCYLVYCVKVIYLLPIVKWFKQTHCITYSMSIDTVMFHCLASEDIRHYVLPNLCDKVGYLWSLEVVKSDSWC